MLVLDGLQIGTGLENENPDIMKHTHTQNGHKN